MNFDAPEPTFEELLQMLANKLDAFEASVPKGLEREVAKGLSEVEGLTEFLKATLSADMRRHFSASEDEQRAIKGAFSRTVYLLALARSKNNLQIK